MSDLPAIETYSIAQFGTRIANKYIDDMETALTLLQDNPGLLNTKPTLSSFFSFYPVREHYLVCTNKHGIIIVLTVTPMRMDMVKKLYLLEPTLQEEADILFLRLSRV